MGERERKDRVERGGRERMTACQYSRREGERKITHLNMTERDRATGSR